MQTNKPHSNRGKRKKVRRRIHWGRVSMLLLIIASIVLIILWIIGAFSSEIEVKDEAANQPEEVEVAEMEVEEEEISTIAPLNIEQNIEEMPSIDADTLKIADYAKLDAERINASSSESFERHQAILHAKARETKLRMEGFNRAADEYIKTVKELCK